MTTYRGTSSDGFEKSRPMGQKHGHFASNDLRIANTDSPSPGIFRVGSLVAGGIVSWALVLLICKVMVQVFSL